ncbi:MAG: 5-dehydro-2-deoxygluconokinase [Geminicoccaceae bacterium]
MSNKSLDVVCIGRSSVDLYGEQVGGRLEDMASFAKYVGGCPTNISVGTARLGLRSALITRVGDEHMGRFIREQVAKEGVDTRGVVTDKDRLTALVILGIRDKHTFPLIFYRENCADSALTEDDIDPALIADAAAVVVTGTHFSRPNLDAASRKAMRLMREQGGRIVLDIDYRPVLWGLTGHGLGEERFVASANVSAHLQTILPHCDLVVGTEEEIHIAGGSTDTLVALKRIRDRAPGALIVVKRGPMGCVAFGGAIPADIEDGVKGPGFPVEVYNVLGAGDAFMSGFLRGWLRDLPLDECCRLANACGAFAVSRHGCAPAIPSWEELSFFLANGSPHRELRKDARIEQLHWSTNRTKDWPQVLAFAFDHRIQLEALADRAGQPHDRIARFKQLCFEAARKVGAGRGDLGILCDDRFGEDTLAEASGSGIWIGRPIERPATVPLRFDAAHDLGTRLREWPAEHCVKCLVFYHPSDPEPLRAEQEGHVLALAEACRKTGHELLLEIIATKSGLPIDATTMPRALGSFYDLGVFPDWWKLPAPASQEEWSAIAEVIQGNDAHCRGVLLLGLEAPEDELEASYALAVRQPVCKGFAVGRTIFGRAAEGWLGGTLDDAAAVTMMAESYGRLVATWDRLKAESR